MVAEIAETRFVIAIDKDTDSFELLAHGILAARKQVHGQIPAYLAKAKGVGQLVRSGEKRFSGRGLEGSETQRVVHECVHDRRIAAQPIEGCARRLKWGVQDVISRRRRFREPHKSRRIRKGRVRRWKCCNRECTVALRKTPYYGLAG
jgi:hypothetical protein